MNGKFSPLLALDESMSTTLADVYRQVLELSPEDQEELTLRLLERLSPPGVDLGPEEIADLQQTSRQLRDGTLQGIDAFEHLTQMRSKYGRL